MRPIHPIGAILAAALTVSWPAGYAFATTTSTTTPLVSPKLIGPSTIPLGQVGRFTVTFPNGSSYQIPEGYRARMVISSWTRGVQPQIRDFSPTFNIDISNPGTYNINIEIAPVDPTNTSTPAYKPVINKIVQIAAPSILSTQITAKIGNTVTRSADVGYPITLTALPIPAWDNKIFTNIPVSGYWTLPNGTSSKESVITYTPTENDYALKNIVFKYTAMVDGQPNTQKTVEYKLPVTKYIWPEFKITSSQDYRQAPITARMKVEPATVDDQKAAAGKTLTYIWSTDREKLAQANLTLKPSGNQAVANIFNGPRQYPIYVEVSDNRGNKRLLTNTILAQEPAPLTGDIKLIPSIKFNRAPMDFMLQTKVAMSHPRDRVVEYELAIDNQPVYKSAETQKISSAGSSNITIPATPPKYVRISQPGNHNVLLRVKSAYGAVGGMETNVDVYENRRPQCGKIEAILSQDRKVVSAKAYDCKDEDGQIKTYNWSINGEKVKNTNGATMMYIVPTGVVPPEVVTLSITDDANGVKDYDVFVTKR